MESLGSYSGVSVEPPTRCSSCLKVSRSVTSFLLSHIGLLSLVVGYCIMGAFIFEELEKENELNTKRSMTKTRLAVSDTLWDITREMEVLHQENWTRQVTHSLKQFEKQLIVALKEKGWDGKEREDTVTWSFTGALFYSITVITTIGYGHIAPKTPIGKIVTIFYAIMGIPLTVLCWSNIGDAMANAFRFCYWKICCYVYVKKSKKRRRRIISRQRGLSMRNPSGIPRSRSIRRNQRPSQRSADSKITTHTADSKLTTQTVDSRPSVQTQDSNTSHSASEPDRFDDQMEKPQNDKTAQPNHKPSKDPDVAVPAEVKLSIAPPKEIGLVDKIQNKVRAAKKSANLSLTLEKEKDPPSPTTTTATTTATTSNYLETPKLSPETEYSLPPLPHHEHNSRGGGGRAILRAERESQRSQYSAYSGGSSGSPGPTVIAVPSIPRGHQQRMARLSEDNWMDEQSYYEEYYYDESEDDMDDYTRKPVPILLSVLLVIAYIVGGAFLFQMWEGWSFLDSSYFCFITLTTIGFGDLTPDQKNVDGEQRIALCSIYLLFGIAMIAMSFNLVQEEVINSVKSVGKMLGIVKDPDDDEDY